MKAAKYSYATAPNGYGGESGLQKPTCTAPYIPIGRLCMTYPVDDAMTFSKAKAECGKSRGKLYGGGDPVQDAIVISRLRAWVKKIEILVPFSSY